MSLFKRNLAKCGQMITIRDRDIVPPAFGSVDFGEEFSGDLAVRAIIKTKRGTTLFDGVNTDLVITHRFCIEYVSGVTAQSWIEFGGRRFNVADVENCCEKNEMLILMCVEDGVIQA